MKKNGGQTAQMRFKTFSIQIFTANHRFPKTHSLRKSNVEKCLVSSIAVLKFQRKSILNLKTFLHFSRTLKMDGVTLEST